MKLTNRKIIDSMESLQKFADKELDIKTSFNIVKNAKKLGEISTIFNQMKTNLLLKYCNKDEKGNPITHEGMAEVTGDNKEKYINELNKLLEAETEVEIEKINVEELGGVKVTPGIIEGLEFMLEYKN